MSETGSTEKSSSIIPVYEVAAKEQADGSWLLTADLPDGELTHEVRTMNDPEWVEREIRTIIASRLGISDDYLRVLITTLA